MAKSIPIEVRRWYQKIGARGGQAGKGTEVRRELMRRNAHIRWNGYKKKKAAEKKELRKILVGVPAHEPPSIGFR